jgi:two-component system NtrC family response regulator
MLVVDQALVRQSLSSWLKKAGCRVLEADDAEEAADLMSENVDVVLVDMRKRGEAGLNLLSWVKRRFPRSEVIMLVGKDQLNLSIRGMKAGAFDDLVAPLDVGLFLGKVAQAVDCRRKARIAGGSSAKLNDFLNQVGLAGRPVYMGLACSA